MTREQQALVKAATETAEDCYECRYDDSHTGMRIAKEAFIYGAEWQRKQSPWISVKDRLPKCHTKVIVCHDGEYFVGNMFYSMFSNWWRISEDERMDMIVSDDDLWVPIPYFDEIILENDKDMIKRMKKKENY